MPVIIGIVIYALLFVGGTAISKNMPQPSPTLVYKIKSTESTPIPSTSNRELYKVLKVIDGDTLNVEIDGKSNTMRLIGIDTPEIVDPRKPVQCYGKEASDKAKELLSEKNVSLEVDLTQGDKDKYNRLLRYVFLEDDTNINKLLISEGYAHEYTYQSNPYKYQKEFIQAQQDARNNKKGLWSDTACITPTLTPTATATIKTTIAPLSTIKTTIYVPPVVQTTAAPPSNSGYSCNCSKNCDAMASCEEAYFQLNQCGCSKRDGDSDGVPCESICN